jgi:phosphate transport system protein
MSIHLERELENLQKDILRQAAAVGEAINVATRALRERSVELAQQAILGDDAIDQLDNQIEEECLKIAALHQPVAVDLRRIASVLKINTELERIGDLAVDIAGRAQRLAQLPPMEVPAKLQQMTDLTTGMVHQSLEAFVNLDAELARHVCLMDDAVDRSNEEIIDELMRAMRESSANIDSAMSLFSATRHLERIADHATNIAENVIYLVEGEIVRHRPEAIQVTRPRA